MTTATSEANRYADAYVVAHTIEGVGLTIKIVGLLIVGRANHVRAARITGCTGNGPRIVRTSGGMEMRLRPDESRRRHSVSGMRHPVRCRVKVDMSARQPRE